MTLKSCDFSTFFIPSVHPADVAQLYAQGFRHVVIGFDSSPDSAAVLHTFLDAGFQTDVYRFLYATRPVAEQIDDVVKGIHAAIRGVSELPGYLWLDVEPANGSTPSTAQISEAMDRVEGYDIKPQGSLVKPGIYSGAWVWQGYYANYTEPASRGWALWTADWGAGDDIDAVHLYGGWTRAEGRQTAGDTASAIGTIDLSVFRDRTPAPPPPPPGPGPDPGLEARVGALEGRMSHVEGELAAIKAAIQ